jgi:hypothetical protein
MPLSSTSLRYGLAAILCCSSSALPSLQAEERRLRPNSGEVHQDSDADRPKLPTYLAANLPSASSPAIEGREVAEAPGENAAPVIPASPDDDASLGETAAKLLRGMRTDGISRSVPAGVPYQPLSTKEKARLQLLSTFQPETLARVAVTAGFATMRDSPEEWPQTINAYQWRFADRIGQRLVYKQVQFTVGSLLLGEDPRYFESANRSTWGRVCNAFKQTWVVRRDNGEWAPAYGTFAGAYAASVVSSRWQPESRREWDDMLRRGSMQIAFQFGNNLAREFFPDLRKWVNGRRGKSPQFADRGQAGRPIN